MGFDYGICACVLALLICAILCVLLIVWFVKPPTDKFRGGKWGKDRLTSGICNLSLHSVFLPLTDRTYVLLSKTGIKCGKKTVPIAYAAQDFREAIGSSEFYHPAMRELFFSGLMDDLQLNPAMRRQYTDEGTLPAPVDRPGIMAHGPFDKEIDCGVGIEEIVWRCIIMKRVGVDKEWIFTINSDMTKAERLQCYRARDGHTYHIWPGSKGSEILAIGPFSVGELDAAAAEMQQIGAEFLAADVSYDGILDRLIETRQTMALHCFMKLWLQLHSIPPCPGNVNPNDRSMKQLREPRPLTKDILSAVPNTLNAKQREEALKDLRRLNIAYLLDGYQDLYGYIDNAITPVMMVTEVTSPLAEIQAALARTGVDMESRELTEEEARAMDEEDETLRDDTLVKVSFIKVSDTRFHMTATDDDSSVCVTPPKWLKQAFAALDPYDPDNPDRTVVVFDQWKEAFRGCVLSEEMNPIYGNASPVVLHGRMDRQEDRMQAVRDFTHPNGLGRPDGPAILFTTPVALRGVDKVPYGSRFVRIMNDRRTRYSAEDEVGLAQMFIKDRQRVELSEKRLVYIYTDPQTERMNKLEVGLTKAGNTALIEKIDLTSIVTDDTRTAAATEPPSEGIRSWFD